MTPDEFELRCAEHLQKYAAGFASVIAQSDDLEAAAAAILCRALELATPELSPQARARLFMEEE